MSDAQHLSDAMTKSLLLLVDQVGMAHDGREYPATIDTEHVPLGGLRAAKIAVEFLMIGIGILDAAIAGEEPVAVPLDDELRALLKEKS